jgi:hypothetical protein
MRHPPLIFRGVGWSYQVCPRILQENHRLTAVLIEVEVLSQVPKFESTFANIRTGIGLSNFSRSSELVPTLHALA